MLRIPSKITRTWKRTRGTAEFGVRGRRVARVNSVGAAKNTAAAHRLFGGCRLQRTSATTVNNTVCGPR